MLRVLVLAILVAVCAGCQSGPGTGFDLTARTSPQFQDDDSLVDLVFAATIGSVEPGDLMISLKAADEHEHVLQHKLIHDENRNGRVDPGDVLRASFAFGETLDLVDLNESLQVILLQRFGSGHKQLWAGAWKPFDRN